MTNTKAKLEFVHAMARHTKATIRQCLALMRYAATLQRLAEDDCNIATDDAGMAKRANKRKHMADRVAATLREIAELGGEDVTGYGAVLSGDPRGAVLKIRVPDGFTGDFGGEGICVPA